MDSVVQRQKPGWLGAEDCRVCPGENYANTFRVENGVLKVSYDQYREFGNRFGHIFYHKRKFSHYIVAAEYRFIGEQVKGGPDWAFRNNGIMFHCQAPETMGKDQDFPISIEAQLLGGRDTASVRPQTSAPRAQRSSAMERW